MKVSGLSVTFCSGLVALALLSGCSTKHTAITSAEIASPASEFCVQKGGELEIVDGPYGGEVGMCHLPDGTIIEEWALFRRDTFQQQQSTP